MMTETAAKYHHLIPRTYLSAWEHGRGTLYVRFLDNEKVIERNKDKIAGVKNYHSIGAGMPIVTLEDADKIFACLENLEVHYGDTIISNNLKLNNIYNDFENWKIYRKDGTIVSKKKLKSEIDKVKIRDIEEQWSTKYEAQWGKVRSELENRILNSSGGIIPGFYKEYLMKIYIALDWRSIKSNSVFNEVWEYFCKELLSLDKINIPNNNRELLMLDNASKEIRHYMLLKFYRQYLNDSGIIYEHAMENLSRTSFHFLVADGMETFNTSDNPAFKFKKSDGKIEGILPLTPRILMVQGKYSNQDPNFYVSHITDETVLRYNAEIKKNASNFIVQLSN